jgi:hypothetical protein
MPSAAEVSRLVECELASIDDPSRREALRALLSQPIAVDLGWGYGKPGERHQCWVVGHSRDGSQRLVYCDKGFGPSDPWGIVGVSEDWMGMDCQWHVGLEHAAIGAGSLDAPDGYEIP